MGELVALSQILPVSYTLGLFYLLRITSKPLPKLQDQGKYAGPSGGKASAAVIDTVYVALVVALPLVRDAADFMPIVLLVRALLIIPLLLGGEANTTYRNTIYSAGVVLTISQALNSLGVSYNTLQKILDALFEHPAVGALAQDAVVASIGSSIDSMY